MSGITTAEKAEVIREFVSAYERQKFGGTVGVFLFSNEYIEEMEAEA